MADSTRRFHTDGRARENFTENGLETLTGQSSYNWGRYVVKELVDNALEAVERGSPSDPRITIDFDCESDRLQYVRTVSVADNGPGIPESRLRKIADTAAFGGTKRHYALPTRGAQGNALMTILGIQHLADGGPLRMVTRGQAYEFRVAADTVEGAPKVTVDTADAAAAGERQLGTRVTVDFGEVGREWARVDGIMAAVAAFVALNPHVTFSIDGQESGGTATDAVNRYEPGGSATTGRVLWFSRRAFKERVKADLRADATLSVGAFVGEFDGLASRQKQQAVCRRIGADTDARLEALTDGNELDTAAVGALYDAMCAETTPRSETNLDNTLGCVGEILQDGTKAYLEQTGFADIDALVENLQANGADVSGWRDLAVYYRGCDVVEAGDTDSDSSRVPFVFELAALPLPPEESTVKHTFGINQSVSYSSPNVSIQTKRTSGELSKYSIQSAFGSLSHGFIVVSNLTCPNIPFEDKGKQSFDTAPFADTISDVVGKAIRKYERDLRPMLNDLKDEPEPSTTPSLPDWKKAPQGFVKEAVFGLFDDVYSEATEGGKFTITMRQLYYEMRPAFQRLAARRGYEYKASADYHNPKRLELKYDTFTSYVDEYEREVLGERVVHRDDRGFFVEPHSDRRVELSTKKVGNYSPERAVNTEYNTLLFVEKTGFYEQLHTDFKITKRYDIGLINAQGYSTTAIRTLIETVQDANPEVELLTLTDLDINGLGIATDADRPDPLSAAASFDATRIGVTPADVERYDLAVESVDYNEKEQTKLENRRDRGEIGRDVYEFLAKGQRVEINAFSPTELKEYVEAKLEHHGVEKIVPSADEVETPEVDAWEERQRTAVQTAIGEYVMQQIDDDFIDALTARDESIALPAEDDRPGVDTTADAVRERISDRLADQPPEAWRDVNEAVLDDLTEEVRDAQGSYEEEAKAAVVRILKEADMVSINPPE